MKFLGIRNGHDCNISYSDGNKVRYIKFERNLQEKHFHWPPIEGHADDMPYLVDKAKEILGVDFRDLDGIALSVDTAHHNVDRPIREEENYFQVDTNFATYWDQFNCPVYNINHHYTHTLSCWPMVDVTEVSTEFVLDSSPHRTRSQIRQVSCSGVSTFQSSSSSVSRVSGGS